MGHRQQTHGLYAVYVNDEIHEAGLANRDAVAESIDRFFAENSFAENSYYEPEEIDIEVWEYKVLPVTVSRAHTVVVFND